MEKLWLIFWFLLFLLFFAGGAAMYEGITGGDGTDCVAETVADCWYE